MTEKAKKIKLIKIKELKTSFINNAPKEHIYIEIEAKKNEK